MTANLWRSFFLEEVFVACMQACMASELNYVSLQSTSNRKVMNPKIVTEFGTRHMDRHVCHFGTMHACVPKMHSHIIM